MKVLHNFNSSGFCCSGVNNLQKFRAGIKMMYLYPEYFGTGVQTTEVPGTGKNVVQNLTKFRVREQMSYTIYRSSGFGYVGKGTPSGEDFCLT